MTAAGSYLVPWPSFCPTPFCCPSESLMPYQVNFPKTLLSFCFRVNHCFLWWVKSSHALHSEIWMSSLIMKTSFSGYKDSLLSRTCCLMALPYSRLLCSCPSSTAVLLSDPVLASPQRLSVRIIHVAFLIPWTIAVDLCESSFVWWEECNVSCHLWEQALDC